MKIKYLLFIPFIFCSCEKDKILINKDEDAENKISESVENSIISSIDFKVNPEVFLNSLRENSEGFDAFYQELKNVNILFYNLYQYDYPEDKKEIDRSLKELITIFVSKVKDQESQDLPLLFGKINFLTQKLLDKEISSDDLKCIFEQTEQEDSKIVHSLLYALLNIYCLKKEDKTYVNEIIQRNKKEYDELISKLQNNKETKKDIFYASDVLRSTTVKTIIECLEKLGCDMNEELKISSLQKYSFTFLSEQRQFSNDNFPTVLELCKRIGENQQLKIEEFKNFITNLPNNSINTEEDLHIILGAVKENQVSEDDVTELLLQKTGECKIFDDSNLEKFLKLIPDNSVNDESFCELLKRIISVKKTNIIKLFKKYRYADSSKSLDNLKDTISSTIQFAYLDKGTYINFYKTVKDQNVQDFEKYFGFEVGGIRDNKGAIFIFECTAEKEKKDVEEKCKK